MKLALIEGLVAFALIIGSGIIVTYIGLKINKNVQDKTLIIKILSFAWIAVNLFLVLVIVLPRPMNYLVAIIPVSYAIFSVVRSHIR